MILWGDGVNGDYGVNGFNGVDGKVPFLTTPLAFWRGLGVRLFYFIFASLSSIIRLISSLSV